MPDPLPLAAGELMGVAVEMVGVEADQLEQLAYPVASGPARGEVAVDLEGLTDDPRDCHPGVERGVGVLPHQLDVPAGPPTLRAREPVQGPAEQVHLARGGPLVADEHRRQRRLARPRLAHDAEGLALAEDQVDVRDGVHRTAPAEHPRPPTWYSLVTAVALNSGSAMVASQTGRHGQVTAAEVAGRHLDERRRRPCTRARPAGSAARTRSPVGSAEMSGGLPGMTGRA